MTTSIPPIQVPDEQSTEFIETYLRLVLAKYEVQPKNAKESSSGSAIKTTSIGDDYKMFSVMTFVSGKQADELYRYLMPIIERPVGYDTAPRLEEKKPYATLHSGGGSAIPDFPEFSLMTIRGNPVEYKNSILKNDSELSKLAKIELSKHLPRSL